MMRNMILTAGLAASICVGGASIASARDSFTIGLSNGWVGSEWRTQMIDEATAAAKAWEAKGVTVKTDAQSSTVDVPGQIAQLRNFINEGVNAILINPNSPTAFDPIIAQAKAKGILVIATDQEVTSKDALYVGIDQKGWAMKSAEWLAKTLNGKGNVVCINGVAGHPANQARVSGYKEVFAKYPGIKVLNEVNADWDEAKGQQAMQTLLATYPDINGVWVQDGMAAGAWRAITDAKKTNIAATGEARVDFLKLWRRQSIQQRRFGQPSRGDGERAERRGSHAAWASVQGRRADRPEQEHHLYPHPARRQFERKGNLSNR